MAILAFQKPDKVVMVEANDSFGKFEFRPLEPGYGVTVGNALRRILLSSLEGFAITSIKIDGVKHEFDTIPGVIEDVTNVILNLKQVRLKQIVSEIENEVVTLTVSGAKNDGVFTDRQGDDWIQHHEPRTRYLPPRPRSVFQDHYDYWQGTRLCSSRRERSA